MKSTSSSTDYHNAFANN